MPARNLILLVAVTVASVAAWFARDRDSRGRRVNEVLALVDAAYINPVDGGELVDSAIDGVVSKLDEHSAFLRGDGQQELEAALDQRFGGVGLELTIDERTGELAVAMPLTGGPAWKAGIVAGDRIKAIDGASTAGLPLREAVAKLRGEPGQEVTLTVSSPAEPANAQVRRDVRLVREVVEIESVLGDRRRADGSWDWWLEGEPGVALLRVTGFGERTAAELDAALAQVTGGQVRSVGAPTPLRGVLIDLRGNPGGLLTAAVDVCDRFLDEGVIVSTRGRQAPDSGAVDENPPDVRRATPGMALGGAPIAVLVDGLTASSAEIVAACLQDHGRATVVGGRTYGKGTIQSILPLDGGGLLKLTTAEYLRPSGATLNRRPDDADDAPWGVVPDEGFGVAPSGEALDRMARWRRLRDMQPAVTLSGGTAAMPRAVDEVLARALDIFPAVSAGKPEFGGEEEAAGDAHEATPAGV